MSELIKLLCEACAAVAPVEAKEPLNWLPMSSAPTTGRGLILLLTPSYWPQVAYSDTWWKGGFSHGMKPIGWYPIPQPLPEPPDTRPTIQDAWWEPPHD